MKPPSYWRDRLCNRFVINTKDDDVILDFVKEIQEDVKKSFCEEYPIRLKAKTPEVQKFMEENNKVIIDMMIRGVGAFRYIDIYEEKNDNKS